MMDILDKCKISKQMLSEWGITSFPITEERFGLIDKIISHATSSSELPFSDEEWNDIIAEQNKYANCAALLYDAPEKNKIEILNDFDFYFNCWHTDKDFFVPLLFTSNKEVWEYMSKEISQKFVNILSPNEVISGIKSYLEKNPNEDFLPFSGTYVEQFLLKEILYGGKLSEDQINNYNTYKIIEFYFDEEELREILGDLSLHNEYVRTAIVNNPYLSDSYKKEAFLIGIDIGKITLSQDSKIMKEIYECAASGIIENQNNLIAKLSAIRCVSNLVMHNLLPESCELDLVKKFANKERSISPDLIEKIAIETPYQSVLKEIIYESKRSPERMFRTVLKNPATTDEMTCDILNHCINPSKLPNLDVISEKHIMLTAARHKYIPIDLCNKLISFFSSPNDIISQLALNPQTPKMILEQIVNNKEYNERDRVNALFNIETLGQFALPTRRKLLNTINAIIDNDKSSEHPFISKKKLSLEEQYLPTSDNQAMFERLKTILNKIINKNEMPQSQYAKQYLKIIENKDVHERLRKSILPINPYSKSLNISLNSFTADELDALKDEILSEVFCDKKPDIDIYGTHKSLRNCFDEKATFTFNNIYAAFCVYENLIFYSELYKDVVNEIESRDNRSHEPTLNTEEREEI